MSVDYYLCPGCGEDVGVGSAGCPTCHAGDDLDFDGDGLELDLPEDDAFDYEKFVAEEFGHSPKKPSIGWFWWAVAVAVLIAFAAVVLGW